MPPEDQDVPNDATPAIKIQLPTNFFQKATISRVLGSLVSSAGIIGIMGSVLYGGAQLYADEYIDGIINERKIVLVGDLLGVNENVKKLFTQQEDIIKKYEEFDTQLNEMQRDGAVDRSILRGLEEDQKEVGEDINEVNRDIKQILRTLQRSGGNNNTAGGGAPN